MKQIIFITIMGLSFSAFSSTPNASVDNLLWGCSKGGNHDAVLVYETSESYKHSSGTIMFIDDQQICDSLNISCPYEAGVYKGMSYFKDFSGKYIYKSVKGKYSDGVIFYSVGGGMKLNSLYTGSSPSVNWNSDWFFNEGECIKQ